MAIPVSVSLSGVGASAPGEDARALIQWVASLECRWIQLDATAAGVRARELDRSGRKDLSATLRRAELALSGLDLFIPPKHFLQPASVDRAVSAILSAVELASDLRESFAGGVPLVATELPPELAGDVRSLIESSADRHGVAVADHRWPATVDAAEGPIGLGFDPASALAAGGDVFDFLTRLTRPPAQARLSDTSSGARVPAGSSSGKLDLVEYTAALAVPGYRSAVVVDLRGLNSPRAAAGKVIAAWEHAVGGVGRVGGAGRD